MAALDISADDFLASPSGYPGVPSGESVLVVDRACLAVRPAPGRSLGCAAVRRADGSVDSLDAALLKADAAPVDRRILVASVGSNSSLAVLRRKLAEGGVSTTFPVIVGTLSGVAVGHSAHVSTPGYIPAAPFALAGARTTVRVSLLDDEQVGCLDATEPNYSRVLLAGADHELDLGGGAAMPAGFHLYDSAHGVIAPPGRAPLPLGSQAGVIGRLVAGCRPFGSHFAGLEPEVIGRELAQDATLRDEVRRLLADEGWSVASGLGDARRASRGPEASRCCRSRTETETDRTEMSTRAPAGPSNAGRVPPGHR